MFMAPYPAMDLKAPSTDLNPVDLPAHAHTFRPPARIDWYGASLDEYGIVIALRYTAARFRHRPASARRRCGCRPRFLTMLRFPEVRRAGTRGDVLISCRQRRQAATDLSRLFVSRQTRVLAPERRRVPSGIDKDIKHAVILMYENRSFDV
jgi:hypothetical protein